MLLIHILLVVLISFHLASPWRAKGRIGGIRTDYWLIQWWSHGMVRVFGVRIEQVGRKHPGPVLWVANHVSWLDIPVLHAMRAVSIVSKAEVRDWPFLGFLARVGGTVFHERGSPTSLKASTQALSDKLVAGRSVAVFPEGRTGPGNRILTFHARMFQVATDAQVPVQPVALEYQRDGILNADFGFRPREQFIPNLLRVLGDPPSIVRVHFLEPLSSDSDRKSMAINAHRAVSGALNFAQ